MRRASIVLRTESPIPVVAGGSFEILIMYVCAGGSCCRRCRAACGAASTWSPSTSSSSCCSWRTRARCSRTPASSRCPATGSTSQTATARAAASRPKRTGPSALSESSHHREIGNIFLSVFNKTRYNSTKNTLL